MTKKHFIALAEMLQRLRPDPEDDFTNAQQMFESTVSALADFCQSQDAQFNRERWLGYIAGTNGQNGDGR